MSDPASIFSKYDGPIADLGSATRDFLLANLPGVLEEADPAGGLIGYGFGPGYKGSICTIIPSTKEIKLGLYKGTELPDPDGLLEGSGKVHRYVVVRSAQDLRKPALRSIPHVPPTIVMPRP
jgi:hypothetical protein